MQQLVQGVHYFQNIGFREREELFGRLQHGQEPEACLITCADSRIVPNLITNSEPVQLFIVRNVGNIVPCYGTSNNGELAAVEYAVVELGIEDLIVCGHTGCGAMQALVNSVEASGSNRTPLVTHWLRHADATLEIIREHYGHLQGPSAGQCGGRGECAGAVGALAHAAGDRLADLPGRVRLHAWMYKIDSGEVFYYESEVGQFVKFGDATVAAGHGIAVAGRRQV